MEINDETCYRALAARDTRFDGLFYVGVTTTGIYCRPICSARTPLAGRCRFFSNSALAEQEGFRPCLRCRPELAPGHAPVDAVPRMAGAAARRIEAGALNYGRGLERLAQDLGTSSRQLRRAVRREFGVSPIELAQTQRLLLAKQLLTESNLPIIKVAFASGFDSVRRFNALFRSHYRLTPTRMRRATTRRARSTACGSRWPIDPPWPGPSSCAFSKEGPHRESKQVEGNTYARTAVVGDHRGWLKVKPNAGRNTLSIEVATSLVPALPEVLARVKSLFDLNARPDVIASQLADDARLGRVAARCPGLRVPGAFDGLELAVRAILGQRVSVKAATSLAGRLVGRLGEPIETPVPALHRLFPSPAQLAAVEESELRSLGISGPRAVTIRAIARAVLGGQIDLEPSPDPEAVIKKLQELPGIGDWTAQYIAMRALRWPDAFPAGDLGLLKAMGEKSVQRLRDAGEAWRPWRAYAAMYLWESQHLNNGKDHDD